MVEPQDTDASAEFDSVLRSKARALAEAVWVEHRGIALRFVNLHPETSAILVDCCMKGMAVGIIGGSSLARDSDGSGEAGETGTGSTEGDSAGRQASPNTEPQNG